MSDRMKKSKKKKEEKKIIGLTSHALVGKKEQVGLMDLIWHLDIKLWSWYVPRRR